jgi:thymidylate kinase
MTRQGYPVANEDATELYRALLNHGRRSAPAGAQDGEFLHLIRFLKKNKISFLPVKKLADPEYQDFISSRSFQVEFEQERERILEWKRDFASIIEEWNEEKIDYILIKSTGLFPHLSDNLDILVRQREFGKASALLVNRGFVDLRNIQEPHKRFFRKFDGGSSSLAVHLHERVCWGVPFDNNPHLWDNYVVSDQDATIHYPCPEDCILINVAHCFLEDHLIKIHDLLTMRACLAEAVDWDYVLRAADEMYWSHALYTGIVMIDHFYTKVFSRSLFPKEVHGPARHYVHNRRWIARTLERRILVPNPTFPFRIPHLWTRIHSSLRVLRDPIFGPPAKRYKSTLFNKLDGLIHLKLGIRNHPRMLVAICGPDGSGKTRHSLALREAFKTCEIVPSYVWSRAGSLPVTNLILKIVRLVCSGRPGTAKKPLEPEMRGLPKNPLFLKLWRWLNVLDLVLFGFIKITIPRLWGKVIISDRYIYDSIIDLETTSGTCNFGRVSYGVLRVLTPKPDLVFFLDATPEALTARGIEGPFSAQKQRYFAYQNLTRPNSAHLIDSTGRFNEVSGRISNLTLTRYFAKYPHKYRGYDLVSLRYK